MKQNDCVLENDFLTLTLRPNGLMDIIHRQTGAAISSGHQLVDQGVPEREIPAFRQREILSRRSPWRCALHETDGEGPVLRLRIRMKVPLHLTPDGLGRSARQGLVKLWTEVTLHAGAPCVWFDTRIINGAADHALFARFLTHQPVKTGDKAGESPAAIELLNPHGLPIVFRKGSPSDLRIELFNSRSGDFRRQVMQCAAGHSLIPMRGLKPEIYHARYAFHFS